MNKKRYSVKEYAKKLGISKMAVYKKIHKDQVEYEKIGSLYLVIDEI